MRKCTVILLMIFCSILKQSNAQQIGNFLPDYLEHYKPEKLHVHFDKSIYNKGETIWFKSYLMVGNGPSDFSRNLVIHLSMQAHELSTKWDEKMEGMNILNRDISHQDILMSVSYYKLRKLKKMFEENQRDMEHAPIAEQMRLIELHQHLKTIEREITKQIGTVILK